MVFAVLALVTVLAGLALAVSENGVKPATTAPTANPAPTETLFVPSPVVSTAATIDVLSLLGTQGSPPSPTPCPRPAGWIPMTLSKGDTLLGLAAERGISLSTLLQANCLANDSTFAGTVVFVPAATSTSAPTVACGPPPGWVFYAVQPGDTLSALSRRYGVAIYDLRQANCLPGVSITVGQNLFVPPTGALPNTATLTNTSQPSQSPLPTAQTVAPATSATPVTATLTVTPVAPLANTATFTPTLTTTSTPTASTTPASTATSADTATLTATDTSTVTDTPTPTPTGTVGP